MSHRVRITCQFEVELDDQAGATPSHDVDELRANGARLSAVLNPVQRVIEETPNLRLVSWTSSAVVLDESE
jgi:hypothetical protein